MHVIQNAKHAKVAVEPLVMEVVSCIYHHPGAHLSISPLDACSMLSHVSLCMTLPRLEGINGK